MDPSTLIARLFGTSLCPPQPLPDSLHTFQSRAELVHAIDGPFCHEPLQLDTLMIRLGERIGQIAQQTIGLIPDVADTIVRLNVALRLWAGCMDAAKTIALETNSGPNTPEGRAATMLEINDRAGADPVYRAGVARIPGGSASRQIRIAWFFTHLADLSHALSQPTLGHDAAQGAADGVEPAAALAAVTADGLVADDRTAIRRPEPPPADFRFVNRTQTLLAESLGQILANMRRIRW